MNGWHREPESLMPTQQPTEMDVVFFAGFYDGEGSACGTKNSNSCIVQVPQKDPELLYRARSLWGGSIRVNGKGMPVWVMSGNRARAFLIAIYPYLSTRRKAQIEKAGGLTLSNKPSLETVGMGAARSASRESMSVLERRRETGRASANKNRHKHKEKQKAWQMANREHLTELQRERRRRLREQQTGNNGNTEPGLFERSQLVQ